MAHESAARLQLGAVELLCELVRTRCTDQETARALRDYVACIRDPAVRAEVYTYATRVRQKMMWMQVKSDRLARALG